MIKRQRTTLFPLYFVKSEAKSNVKVLPRKHQFVFKKDLVVLEKGPVVLEKGPVVFRKDNRFAVSCLYSSRNEEVTEL